LKNKHINEVSRQPLTVDYFWQTFQQNHSLKNYVTPLFETTFIVAYSGGCDSHVLLHILSELKKQNLIKNVSAVHVNHQLHKESDSWAEHCVSQCKTYNIPCDVFTVNVNTESGKGVESAARTARYAALENVVHESCFLLAAQHADDQVETFLLQSLRGSGVKGLAAMPLFKPFSKGLLCRPLLSFSQNDILEYAHINNLEWIEDPSNSDTKFDRNYLRKNIMPLLKERWPAINKTLLRVTEHQAEAVNLIDDLAIIDLDLTGTKNGLLAVTKLNLLSESRRKNVIRYWLHNIKNFSMPNSVHMNRILTEVLNAPEDATPCVTWDDVIVRRFKNELYVDINNLHGEKLVNKTLSWSGGNILLNNKVKLITEQIVGDGVSVLKLKDKNIEIRFRQGGEVCCPVGRGPHKHKLKKLLQEWGVPPWLRDSIPLVYADDDLVQVVGFCVCDSFAAKSNENGFHIYID